MKSFGSFAEPPSWLIQEAESADGLTIRQLAPGAGSAADRRARIERHFAGQVRRAKPATVELEAIIAAHDPVALLQAVVVPTMTGLRRGTDSFADAPDTVTWPAKIEYILGLILATAPGSRRPTNRVAERVMSLVDEVFEGAHAAEVIASFQASEAADEFDEVRFMLRLEALFDRMPGYAMHLEQIDAEVFDRHREHYVERLGFNPADVVRVVRRYLVSQQRVVNDSLAVVPQGVSGVMRREQLLGVLQFVQKITEATVWRPSEVETQTSVPAEEIEAILQFFSAAFESQPGFRSPLEPNLARSHPVLALGPGAFFVADPWALPAAVHSRMADLARDGALPRYHQHRQLAHQRLVEGAFAIFRPHTFANRHYVAKDTTPGEVDVLVAIEHPLVIEAKAQSLTEPGRRGAPARLQTVIDGLHETALRQTSRACTYIELEDGRTFSARQGGPGVTILPEGITGTTAIVVTFERMDPVNMLATMLTEQAGRDVWICGIADLLMVVDVLSDPVTLHHYARTRARLTADGIRVVMESDALALYLKDRVAPLLAADAAGAMKLLGYTSEAINNYYTGTELGADLPIPSAGLPVDVVQAMTLALSDNGGHWSACTDVLMLTPSAAWRRWRSFRRKHRLWHEFKVSPELRFVSRSDQRLKMRDGTYELLVETSRG